MKKSSCIIAIFFALISFSALAQDCSVYMQQGIYDARYGSSDVSTATAYKQWFCDQKFQSHDQATKFGANIGLPFAKLPVKLGFDGDIKNYDSWQSKFCSNTQLDETTQSKVVSYLQQINPKVIQAVESCLKSNGLHVWLERSFDPHVFVFAAYWNPSDSKHDPTTSIVTFETGPNVQCTTNPTKMLISNNEFRTRCTRQDDKSVMMVVTTNPGPIRGAGKLSLPEITKSTVPPTPPPVSIKCGTAKEVVLGIYDQILDRKFLEQKDPDEQGLATNISAITSGRLNVHDLVNAFVHSDEYKSKFVNNKSNRDIITNLYKRVLARTENPSKNDDGFYHQLNALPKIGFGQIATNFANSTEYLAKFGNWTVPGAPAKIKYCN